MEQRSMSGEETRWISPYTLSLLRVFFSSSEQKCGHYTKMTYSTQCDCNGGEEVLNRACKLCMKYAYYRCLGIDVHLSDDITNVEEFRITCTECHQPIFYQPKEPNEWSLKIEKMANACFSFYFYIFFGFGIAFMLLFGSCVIFRYSYPEINPFPEWLYRWVLSIQPDSKMAPFAFAFELMVYRNNILVDRLKSILVVDSNENPFVRHLHLD
jgi:hypothetical protein